MTDPKTSAEFLAISRQLSELADRNGSVFVIALSDSDPTNCLCCSNLEDEGLKLFFRLMADPETVKVHSQTYDYTKDQAS